ncbi:MAG: peptidylprolyl isomerase [Deltaproteobacteria bacterium]|nr:MAG: peptidylprolyl isomerase [Deltaproteobacteria bacterium]
MACRPQGVRFGAWAFVGLAALLGGLACDRPSAAAPQETPPVAVVNGEPIPASVVQRELLRLRREAGSAPVHTEAELETLRRELLDDRIDRLLLLQLAKERGIEAEPGEVERLLLRLRADYPGDTFEEFLADEGIPLSQLKAELRERVLIQRLLQREVRARVVVTDDEIQAYYDSHPEEFKVPEQVHARQIVVKTREEAEALRTELRKRHGPDFAEVARSRSIAPEAAQGGDLGWFERGVMPPPFDVCFDLPVGRVSEVVESPYGYHLFQVLERRKARVLSLDEARDRIEAKLRREKEKRAQERYVALLRETAKIEINEAVLGEIR